MDAAVSGPPLLGGLALLACFSFEMQIRRMASPGGLENRFPADWVLFLQSLERDYGILGTAFDDDVVASSLLIN